MTYHQRGMKVCIALLGLLAAVFFTSGLHADCSLRLEELGELKGLIKRQAYLKDAIKKCPDDYLINYLYGYNLERLRKYDESLKYYQKAAGLNPDFPKTFFGAGDVYLVQGRNEDSITAFEKGLALDPENIRAQRSLQKARRNLQEISTLNKEAPQVIQHVDSPHIADSRTISPLKVNAVPMMKKVVSEQPDSSVISAEGFIRRMTVDDDESGGASNPVLQMQIQFNRSSDKLTDNAMQELENVVCSALQSEELLASRFEVAGHTDNSGDFELNMYLSKMRARSVRDFLIKKCSIAAGRLTVVYYGPTRPAVPNTSVKNRKLNRRVEFRRLD